MRRSLGIFAFLSLFCACPAGSVEYTAADLRDPFSGFNKEVVKLEATEKPEASLQLSGLVWGGHLTQAIIDGRIVHVGDKIGSADVLEISKEGVRLKTGSEEVWIRPKENLT